VHLEALRRFPFDTVLTPYNYRLARESGYLRDFDALAAETRARDVGLMVIKVAARNLWRPEGGRPYATWYEPLDVQELIDATVAFALARPEITGICTAGDVNLLRLFVEAEQRRESITVPQAETAMAGVTELEPPFVRVPGREVPDWLEPLMEDR
jgi:hypothetical protein